MTPEMNGKLDRFRHKALALGVPAEDVARWLGLARPCATLSPRVDGPVVGHLGPPVMLPADAPDPDDGQHLIATLDLAALPADATDLPLPQDGHLLLFANPDGVEAACFDDPIGSALYIPAGTPVKERHVDHGYGPKDPNADLDSKLVGELRLASDVSLPGPVTIIDTAAHPYEGELREVMQQLWWEHRDRTNWSHNFQIDGYAFHGDEYTDPVKASAEWSAEAERKGQRPGTGRPSNPDDWVLLAEWDLEIDHSETPTLHWTVRKQDLEARRFDRAFVSMFFAP